MNGRVFICHHAVPARVLTTRSFVTLQSGAYDDEATGVLGDLGGQNIAALNGHSEMRHQYHVWRERLAGLDYVGFEHYRRWFFVNPLNAGQLHRFDAELLNLQRRFLSDELHVIEHIDDRSFKNVLELRRLYEVEVQRTLDRLLTDNDVVTQRAHRWRIDEQWGDGHSVQEWQTLVDVVRSTGFFRRSLELLDFRQNHIRFCNMYIMRIPVFLTYMEFWDECMKKIAPRVEETPRNLGYFAERIFNFFIYGMRLQDANFRVGMLPCVFDRQW